MPNTTTAPADPAAEADRLFWQQLTAVFPLTQVEKLPRNVKKDDREKFKCEGEGRANRASIDGYSCGGYHALSVHLDYVGHAGITMRLNDVCGPDGWSWEPAHFYLPTPIQARFDKAIDDGNLEVARFLIDNFSRPEINPASGSWMKLTVKTPSGKVVEFMGFGDAENSGSTATKVWIGDALRNAAMRAGIGTYLWSKSEDASALKKGINPQVVADRLHGAVEGDGTAEQKKDALIAAAEFLGGADVLGGVRMPDGRGSALDFVKNWVTAFDVEIAQGRAEGSQDAQPSRTAPAQREQQPLPAVPAERPAQRATSGPAEPEQPAQAQRAPRKAAEPPAEPALTEGDARSRLLAEVLWQAGQVGVIPASFIQELLREAQVQRPEQLPVPGLLSWTIAKRGDVIKVLVEAKKDAAADKYAGLPERPLTADELRAVDDLLR